MFKNFVPGFAINTNIPYEALICYANITEDFLEIDSGFIPECGHCRTCFRGMSEDETDGRTSLQNAYDLYYQ